MVAQVTEGVKISVEAVYQPQYSNPASNHFLFSYTITIENQSAYTVQLLRRHWHIFDSDGTYREVEGEGIVGEQPILIPETIHQYSSACNLTTEMGTMHGTYQMKRELDGHLFDVEIPRFELVCPYKWN